MNRDYGFSMFSSKLVKSSVTSDDLLWQRRLTDILISVCTVIGFLICTGSVQMWAKKREDQRVWRHSVSVAMFTLIVIRVIFVYFFFIFLDICEKLGAENQ